MGIGKGFNSNSNNNKILTDSAFKAPKIKPAKIEKASPAKDSDSSKDSNASNDDSGPNIAFSIFGLDATSPAENLQVILSKGGDRSGPGNLPGKSSVTYDLSEVDLGDYGDDNSFNV